MLAQRDLELYTPPQHGLATIRRDISTVLSRCSCTATRQRILLAVNEIIANVLRHSTPSAADLQVNFIDHEGKVHCVIRDDGGPFVNFPKEWEKAGGVNEADLGAHLGLRLVRSLWPEAFYIPRSETFPYNSFILPLTSKGSWRLPPYFRPSKEKKFRDLVLPLAMREDKQ